MEYYLYISDSKIDMLLPQVPEKTKAKVAAGFGVNLGVLHAELKSERDTGAANNRIARLQTVLQHMKPSIEIGTVDKPGKWIEDVQDARTIYLAENEQVVFFVGNSAGGTRPGLGGSAAYLISRGERQEVRIGWSFLPDLLQSLQGMLTMSSDSRFAGRDDFIRQTTEKDEFEWMDLLNVVQRMSSGPSPKNQVSS